MAVIVTRYTSSTGTSTSGSGAFNALEKLSLEMEMEFKAAQLYNYKEFGYNAQKLLSTLDIYQDETKAVQLFSKTFSYTSQKLLEQTYLTRISDGEALVRFFSYNAQKNLISVETSGSGSY
jgi:hypothetical protein